MGGLFPSYVRVSYQLMEAVLPQVLELKACVVTRGCNLRGTLGSCGVCKCPGMSQSILLPLEDSDRGCVGNWKTSGSCSSEPFHCGNFHLRSLDFVARWGSSLQSGCCASHAGSTGPKNPSINTDTQDGTPLSLS